MISHITSIESIVVESLASITGQDSNEFRSDMHLESDIGLDSLKMVELWSTLSARLDGDARVKLQQSLSDRNGKGLQTVGDLTCLLENVDPSSPTSKDRGELSANERPSELAVPLNHDDVAASFQHDALACVAQVTGHEHTDLSMDQYLEADLGLDSIKLLSLMDLVLKAFPSISAQVLLAAFETSNPNRVRTLGELVVRIAELQQANPAVDQVPSTPCDEAPRQAVPSGEVVDLLDAQYPFLVSHDVISTCSLCSHLRVQGVFHIDLAQRAWQHVITKHLMLRVIFEIPEDARSFNEYHMQVVSSSETMKMMWRDLRTQTLNDREKVLRHEMHAQLNRHWELNHWPLHQFVVFQLTENEWELMLSHHHLIADGLSIQQLWRDFFEQYERLTLGDWKEGQKSQTIDEYRRMARAMNTWPESQGEQMIHTHAQLNGGHTYMWNPLNRTRQHDRADVRTHQETVDEATTSALIAKTQDWQVSLYTLLVSCYLRALQRMDPSLAHVVMNVPTSGRVYPSVDAIELVGCFAQNVVVAFELDGQTREHWPDLIEHVHHRLEQALFSGVDRAQTRQLANMVRHQVPLKDGHVAEDYGMFIRSNMATNLYLPYMGDTGIRKTYGGAHVVGYQAATTTNTGTLDTAIERFHGRLTMTYNYDALFFSHEVLAKFAKVFQGQIRDLLNHTALPNNSSVPQKVWSVDVDSLVSQLCAIASTIAGQHVGVEDISKDLEAELGWDSLDRMRLLGKLQQQYENINRESVLRCRSLDGIVAVLSDGPIADQEISSERVAEASPSDDCPLFLSSNELESKIPYHMIIEQCWRHPEAIAVQGDGRHLTYGDLDEQSTKLANFLQGQGVERGHCVGVLLHRHDRLHVAILGILKVGAAYVPVDPQYPDERIRYILTHSQCSTLISEEQLSAQWQTLSTHTGRPFSVVLVDELKTLEQRRHPDVSSPAQWSVATATGKMADCNAEDIMVILYTSGSTGRPKGVALSHQGYMNRLLWHQSLFPIQAKDRVAQKTSIGFDISIWELFWPLMFGATSCPVDHEMVKDSWRFAAWIERMEISVIHFVPSLFGEFLEALTEKTRQFPVLRWIIFSGEALPVPFVRRWMSVHGHGVGLANLYGPTEASIDVTAHLIDEIPEEHQERISIGKAMPGVYLKVLNEAMKECPVGEMGELWIGGIQLAHGYLHDDERTRERFQPNPFSDIPGEVLYKTGDLVKAQLDGSLEYFGRSDLQVKVRGFRVELGEIEAAVLAMGGVKEAGVVCRESDSGQKRLVAWLTGTQRSNADMHQQLKVRLPTYMVPHRFRWTDILPKNANGKLDRAKLMEWEQALSAREQSDLEAVDTGDAPVSGKTPSDVGGQKILEYRRALAPAQKWIIRYFGEPYQWTGFSRFRFLQPLDLTRFNRALTNMVARYAALRVSVKQQGAEWIQEFQDCVPPMSAIMLDGSHLRKDQRENAIREQIATLCDSLRLDTWPLWKVLVVKESEESYSIAIVGHHMIGDMISNGVLFRALWKEYSAQLLDVPGSVSEGGDMYENYLAILEQDPRRDEYIKYWYRQFPTADCQLCVPFDHQRGPNIESSSARYRVIIPNESVRKLYGVQKRQAHTFYHLLLAPLYLLLGEWASTANVVVSHRTHGRDCSTGLSLGQTVGNLAVNYPVGVECSEGMPWERLLHRLQTAFSAVPLKGVSYDLVGDALPSHAYPDVNLTPVRANFLGNRTLPESTVFEWQEDDRDQRFAFPDQKRTSLIEIFFSEVEGTLCIDWDYSSNYHSEETIQTLSTRYEVLLNEMIAASHPTDSSGQDVTVGGNHFLPQRRNGNCKLASNDVPVNPRALSEKVAIVTGASRGIGRAVATRLASSGARLALVGRQVEDLESVRQEILIGGGEAMVFAADVRNFDDVQQMVEDVATCWGGIDMLINNAGITGFASVRDSDPTTWRNIFEVNLFGMYYCTRAVLPFMEQRNGGKIVNMGSDSSFIGYPLFSAYAASKHAVLGFTKALAEELKAENIQVNAVCPSFVKTTMTPNAFRPTAIAPEQVADVVNFLASPQSNSITGEDIKVFGQQDMYWYGSAKMNLLEDTMSLKDSAA